MVKASILSGILFIAILSAFLMKVEVISIWGFLICMTIFSVGCEIESKIDVIKKRDGNGW